MRRVGDLRGFELALSAVKMSLWYCSCSCTVLGAGWMVELLNMMPSGIGLA